MRHREVIRFVCGITDDKKSMLEFVFDTLLSTFVSLEKDDKEFFGLLCDEVFGVNQMDSANTTNTSIRLVILLM